MLRATFALLTLICISFPAQCQTSEPQARTMEAVLTEIRQLRQDLQLAAIATRKAQIVIYRLHVQQEVLRRATERVDNVTGELNQIENQKKYQAEQIKRLKEVRDRAETDQQKKQIEENLTALEGNQEFWEPREQELQTQRIELEAELRTEQSKWAHLEDELERLENQLDNSALQASNPH